MMFCEQCGTRLDDDSLFCPQCGARVSEAVPPAPPVSLPEVFAWLQLTTDHGEEPATAEAIRAALSAAAADADEYAKLTPLTPGKDAVSLLAYSPDGGSELSIQVIVNERKNRYDACYEKEGFSPEAAAEVFLSYAQSRRLPADYPDWGEL